MTILFQYLQPHGVGHARASPVNAVRAGQNKRHGSSTASYKNENNQAQFFLGKVISHFKCNDRNVRLCSKSKSFLTCSQGKMEIEGQLVVHL